MRNYGSDGPGRKTKTYLETREITFGDLMKDITERHEKLEPLKDTLKEQPYFHAKSYDGCKILFDKTMANIEIRLKALKTGIETDDNDIVLEDTTGGKTGAKSLSENLQRNDESASVMNGPNDGTDTIENGDNGLTNNLVNCNENQDTLGENESSNIDRLFNQNIMLECGDLMATILAANNMNQTSSYGLVKAQLEIMAEMW